MDEKETGQVSIGKTIFREWVSLASQTYAYLAGRFNLTAITYACWILLTYLLIIGHTGSITWVVFGILVAEYVLLRWRYLIALTGIRQIQAKLKGMGLM